MKVLVIGGSGFIDRTSSTNCWRTSIPFAFLTVDPERFRAPLTGVDYRFGEFTDEDDACRGPVKD